MITREDILSYMHINRIDAAICLLLLAGHDGFDGTVNDYDTLMSCLERRLEREERS